MNKGSIRIGKIFGIEIALDYSWFIIFFLITWSLANHYLMVYSEWSAGFRFGIAVVTAILFFGSILAHELGHSLVARATGTPVQSITLFIFGGVAKIKREPARPIHEFLIAAAGPLTSLALGAGFWLLWILGQSNGNTVLDALGHWLGQINIVLALFNLLPGFPLDGGRIFRAIVWAVTKNLEKATKIAGGIGRLIAWVFIFAGIWQVFAGNWANGLWIAFIGWFLDSAAKQNVEHVAIAGFLKGHFAREVMSSECPRVSPNLSVEKLVHCVILPSGKTAFPVTDGERVIGLVTISQVKSVKRGDRPDTTVSQIMIPASMLATVSTDEDLSKVMELFSDKNIKQAPVLSSNGALAGMVAADGILGFVKTKTELLGNK